MKGVASLSTRCSCASQIQSPGAASLRAVLRTWREECARKRQNTPPAATAFIAIRNLSLLVIPSDRSGFLRDKGSLFACRAHPAFNNLSSRARIASTIRCQGICFLLRVVIPSRCDFWFSSANHAKQVDSNRPTPDATCHPEQSVLCDPVRIAKRRRGISLRVPNSPRIPFMYHPERNVSRPKVASEVGGSASRFWLG